MVEGDHEEGTTAAAVSDSGYPGAAEDLDATAVREHSDARGIPPLGGNPAKYEEAVATNEDYEADYNENDPDSEPGETVTIEGDTRDGDWETAASDAQQTQDDLGQHELQDDADGMANGEQVPRITITNDLTAPFTGFDTVDLTAPGLDDGPQQGKWHPSPPPLPPHAHRLTLQ